MTQPRLHIVTTVPQSTYTLLAGQPRRLSSHFEVSLVSSPGPDLEASGLREGVPTFGVDMTRSITPLADLRALGRLYRLFREQRPEIVQSYTPKAGLLAMSAARLARVPVRVHGIVGMPLMEARGWKQHLLAATERLTYAMTTHLLCNSTGLARWTATHLAPRRDITVVREGSVNGVDLERFRPVQEADRQRERGRLGIPPDATVFVFLGRLVRAKGVEELLQAFAALQQDRDDVVLLMVGDEEEALDPLSPAAVGQLRAGAGVIHLGWRDDVRPLLAAADVCVLPSHREGLPNTLLEAAACGLPSLASDINGCNEVIVHDRTGLLVPAKDPEALLGAMGTLLDPVRRKTMGESARDRVEARYEHVSFCTALQDYYLQALPSAEVPVDRVSEPR